MPFVRPSLVVDSTTTSGTGTYTLTDPASPGGGFRTLADAVADGDVTAGDTISYFVVDTTSEGATLTWEHGIGTVGAGGLTLARTSITESSNGDAAVSWPSGGSRTVRFGAGTSGFALLAAANTFAALQTLAAGLSLTSSGIRRGELVMDASGSTGPRFARYLVDGTTLDTSLTLRQALAEWGASTVQGWAGSTLGDKIRLFSTTYGLAINSNELTLYRPSGATVTIREAASGTVVGNVDHFPTGTRLTFHATPPTGWTRVNVTGERIVKLATASDTIAATGGSWTISGLSVDAHTLTEAQIPAHTHNVRFYTSGSTTADSFPQYSINSASNTLKASESTGGGGSHTHGLSSAGTWRPAFSIACIGEKS